MSKKRKCQDLTNQDICAVIEATRYERNKKYVDKLELCQFLSLSKTMQSNYRSRAKSAVNEWISKKKMHPDCAHYLSGPMFAGICKKLKIEYIVKYSLPPKTPTPLVPAVETTCTSSLTPIPVPETDETVGSEIAANAIGTNVDDLISPTSSGDFENVANVDISLHDIVHNHPWTALVTPAGGDVAVPMEIDDDTPTCSDFLDGEDEVNFQLNSIMYAKILSIIHAMKISQKEDKFNLLNNYNIFLFNQSIF